MLAPIAGDAACWEAVRRRDRAADGRFVYSVRTTGIYCRPSCPARLARRENVRFHAGPVEAEAAGFRACKRCRPKEAGSVTGKKGLLAQVSGLDRPAIAAELDDHGCAVTGALLSAEECAALAASYEENRLLRSRVAMRHGVSRLRTGLRHPLGLIFHDGK